MALTKVTKSGIGTDAVDGPKIEADSISTAKIADSAITLAKLSATGTKDATTFLIVYPLGMGLLSLLFSLSGSWAWGGDQLELQPEDIALRPEMVGGMPP